MHRVSFICVYIWGFFFNIVGKITSILMTPFKLHKS